MVEFKQDPQLIKSCGFEVLVPSESEHGFLDAMIESLIKSYNNDIIKVMEDYPLNEIIFDFGECQYCVESMEATKADMLLAYHNYINYKFFEPHEQEFNDLIVMLNITGRAKNKTEKEVEELARKIIIGKEKLKREEAKSVNTIMNNNAIEQFIQCQYSVLNNQIYWMQCNNYNPAYIQQYTFNYQNAINCEVQRMNYAMQQQQPQYVQNELPQAAYTNTMENTPNTDSFGINFGAFNPPPTTMPNIQYISNFDLPPHPEPYHPNHFYQYQYQNNMMMQQQQQAPVGNSMLKSIYDASNGNQNALNPNPTLKQKQEALMNKIGNLFGQAPQMQNKPQSRFNMMDPDSWMYPTEEELMSGKNPTVYTTIHGVDYNKPSNERTWARSTKPEEFKVCVRKTSKDDDGNTVYTYYGHKEAIEDAQREDEEREKEANLPSDYKEASVLVNGQKRMRMADLIDGLKKYNKEMASYLQMSFALSDPHIEQIRHDCEVQLKKYMDNDPLAKVRSGEQKKLNREEITKFLEQQRQYYMGMKDKAVQQAEYLIGLAKEVEIVEENLNDSEKLIRKLQSLSNLPIFYTEEECLRDMEMRKRFDVEMTPLQYNAVQSYKFWKLALKNVAPEGVDYDEYFDNWWNKPKVEQQKVDNDPETIRTYMSGLRMDRLNRMSRESEYVKAMQRQEFDNLLNRKFREFDLGMIPLDQSLNDFFNGSYGLGYLMHRCSVMEYKRQIMSTRRKYNPELFDYQMRNNVYVTAGQSNIPYEQIVSSAQYNQKRQNFMNALFKKNAIGAITK